jgi:hypothetical protein
MSPNARLQPTRLGPSGRRWPLSRKPLGDTKNPLWLIAMLAVLALACHRERNPSQALGRSSTPVPVAPSPTDVPTQPEVVYKVGYGVSAPRLLGRADPAIPAKCRRVAFDWGAFIFEATISATGQVTHIRTIKRPNLKPPCPELEEAYRQAISSWNYEPGKLDGRPVPVYLTISVAFHPR